MTASEDGSARLWDSNTGAVLFSLTGHTKSVRTASFAALGSRIVTASEDGTARLWDVKTGLLLMTFSDHQGTVYSAAASPIDKHIVTAGEDGLAYVYSTKLDFCIKQACELYSVVTARGSRCRRGLQARRRASSPRSRTESR